MAHPEQREFFESVRLRFPHMFAGVKVLDVGSLNINGTVKDFFTNCEYIGVDLEEGPGVDLVGQGQELKFPDRHFSTVVSAECFEHNPYWVETFINMHRMCDGLVVVTCATEGRPEHGTSRTTPQDSPFTVDWNYYQNLTEEDFERNFYLDAMFVRHNFSVNPNSHDLYFWGLVR